MSDLQSIGNEEGFADFMERLGDGAALAGHPDALTIVARHFPAIWWYARDNGGILPNEYLDPKMIYAIKVTDPTRPYLDFPGLV